MPPWSNIPTNVSTTCIWYIFLCWHFDQQILVVVHHVLAVIRLGNQEREWKYQPEKRERRKEEALADFACTTGWRHKNQAFRASSLDPSWCSATLARVICSWLAGWLAGWLLLLLLIVESRLTTRGLFNFAGAGVLHCLRLGVARSIWSAKLSHHYWKELLWTAW